MNKITKIVAGVGLILMAVGVYTMVKSAPESTVIKIGVIGTLTGNAAYFGQQELRGVELARDEINKNGGINGKMVELIVEDSAAAPATAVSAARKLIETDNVKYIVGDSWNSTVIPMLPVINENKVILISPFAGLNQMSQDDYFFRTIASTKDMMDALAVYAYDKGNARSVAIVQAKNPFGEEHTKYFKEAFEKRGGVIVAIEGVELTQEDVRTELIKIKAKKPDTILNIHAAGPKMGVTLKQAKELGIKVSWLGQLGAENATLQKDYKDIAEGIVYPYPFDVMSGQEEAKRFAAMYQEKYHEMPELVAANSYDAMMILAKTIAVAGDDTQKAKEFMGTIKDFAGAGGSLSFDQNGDVKKDIIIKTMEDGIFVKAE
ncbi:MAG: Extracellular ligand-binding receptor [Candidatus Wolfebacteria bacterium GW2011_GWE1_48_7]|uniref:Extracellular ligand-binding receptor n=2 Tax=Candidatus Wolfeibacteriota TaxID=1752735 RepID=A0A0G1U8B5_9BACT|nr:MAG: Extracellular ligand-binding receptor [Candidatus Wolfebacteria bacterium GW2011_GWB1_47_1]KKU36374.1 MAG: Extracellular ligand-binding receptor [Candidatus Wolfebacteria bacterium GW2011_GWC2_46_275]KKU42049.1 MAG: Extracellular ligand-binding receptor [Candidatus Wolfebacteria bacterium GW2011_GWB2_46_69]KKU54414.1 MAG: Extracellular ligand-binding receptor [Candidatus Wolfebacteria bacterium GW2011_GWC1_47_103]KKU59742.1 MAG: Extracellular ligand-binding receptor [Candidatus Wolfebac